LTDTEIAYAMARPAAYVIAAVYDSARRRPIDAGNSADERSLAGTVGADNGDNRALVHVDGDMIKRLSVAVKYVEILDPKH
jgi:hypothetical protein